jgi:MFS family permease
LTETADRKAALQSRRDATREDHRAGTRLPRDVVVLGVVSLLMDTSSELVHGLLPVFMASVLGAGMTTIGLVEGVAEATSAFAKVLSGGVSDRWRRRKPLVVLGYGLSFASKPLFPLAAGMTWVFAARFVDRLGKGIRVAPRDALVADITPPALRGAAYGLRQSLDTVGAVAGPLAAIALMWWLAGDIRTVLWMAVAPAALAVAVLVVWVREPEVAPHGIDPARRLALGDVSRLPRAFWHLVALGGVMTLARFGAAFLVLRASDVGLSAAYVPAVLAAMNVTYAAGAYPAGRLADRRSPRGLIAVGLALLILADVVLVVASTPAAVLAGAALSGVHLAFTQGSLSKLIADAAPADRRGLAFGMFNLVIGVALLAASVIAGALWSVAGPAATFGAGAVFAALALAGVVAAR